MNNTNLVPLARQIRDARSSRVRLWSFALGGAIAASAAAYAACAAATADGAAPAPAEFAHAARDLAEANANATRAKAQLARVRREIYSARTLADQPDLSLLLALLSRNVDDSIVLDRCELSETSPAPVAGSPKDASVASQAGVADSAEIAGAVVRLDGLGRSQAAVAGFVLQLETAGLFDRVTLLQSHGQPVFDKDAVAFRIECQMQPGGKGATP